MRTRTKAATEARILSELHNYFGMLEQAKSLKKESLRWFSLCKLDDPPIEQYDQSIQFTFCWQKDRNRPHKFCDCCKQGHYLNERKIRLTRGAGQKKRLLRDLTKLWLQQGGQP